MNRSLKLIVVSLALVVSGVLVSPSAQVEIQRGFSTAYNLTVQNIASFADGTAAAPSIAFAAATGTGWNRDTATGNVRLSIGGSTVGTFTSGGTFTAPGEIIATTGMYPGGYAILNGTGRASWSGRSSLYSNANGNIQATNAAATNTYDITLADWGTTLSAEPVSVANDALLFLGGINTSGTLFVSIGTLPVQMGLYGPSEVAAIFHDTAGSTSVTKDTPAKTNFYYDAAGPSGAGYYLQNKTGFTASYRLLLIGA